MAFSVAVWERHQGDADRQVRGPCIDTGALRAPRTVPAASGLYPARIGTDPHLPMLRCRSEAMLLYYRSDVFEAAGLAVPASWEELVALAVYWNSRNVTSSTSTNTNSTNSSAPAPRHGLCLNDAPSCALPFYLSALVASATQRWGPATGWALALDEADPDAAVQLANSSAMHAAMPTLRALLAASPPGLACQEPLSLFASGQCLMTLAGGRQFKALQGAGVPVRGAVGIELLPGAGGVGWDGVGWGGVG